LQTNPTEGLKIFTEDGYGGVQRPGELLHDQVLSHLKDKAPTLCNAYLEHIIFVKHNTNPEFHNSLVFDYLRVVQEDIINKRNADSSKKKLLTFLENSQYYNAEKMLIKFPADTLEHERAILLSRIGQHEQALRIYARLGDTQMAEEYCKKYYNTSSEEARDVYLSLLRVYLKPDGKKPMLQPALAVLIKHYKRIDTPKALDLMPADTPVRDLEPFFEAVLRENSQQRRHNQIVKNLLKTENLQVREQLIKSRSHMFKVTEDRMCQVCHRRLGDSVPACYPNGTVVHFMCCKDRSFDPVTNQSFTIM